MKEKNIVFISDSNQKLFALTNAIMIFSQTSANICIYLIFIDLTDNEKKEIDQILLKNKIDWLKIIYKSSESMELGISKLGHVSNTTNARLYLSSILKNINNVLYLDNDTVVIGDINELFENLDYSFSYGRPWFIKNKWISKLRRKKLFNNEYYVNAGVLFLNLEYWRNNNIENDLITFLVEKDKVIKFADQDSLNCNINFRPLPYTWNLARDNWEKTEENIANNSNLKIYHFLSTFKQWQADINLDNINSKQKGSLTKKELKKMIEPQKIWKKYHNKIIGEKNANK